MSVKAGQPHRSATWSSPETDDPIESGDPDMLVEAVDTPVGHLVRAQGLLNEAVRLLTARP